MTDKLNPDEQAFAERTGRRLRQSADELDAATQSRLNRARQRALDEMPAGTTRRPIGWWVPAGATAVAAVLVIGIWQARGPGEMPVETGVELVPVTADEAVDFEILLEEGDLEMLEDLEFFAWLALEDLEAAG